MVTASRFRRGPSGPRAVIQPTLEILDAAREKNRQGVSESSEAGAFGFDAIPHCLRRWGSRHGRHEQINYDDYSWDAGRSGTMAPAARSLSRALVLSARPLNYGGVTLFRKSEEIQDFLTTVLACVQEIECGF